MKKNTSTSITAIDLSDQGYGVGKIDGKTIFIKDLLPQEKAQIKIIKEAKDFDIAIVEQRETDSPARSKPFCPLYLKCGGCAFGQLHYSDQLAWKQKQLDHLFKKVNSDIEVLPILSMEHPWHYRNKAQFPISIKDGQIQAGFYRPKSHDLIDLDKCALQQEKINEIYHWIKNHLSLSQAKDLRHLFIRYSKSHNQAQVVFTGLKKPELSELVSELCKVFPEIKSVVFSYKDKEDNVILGDRYDVLYGSDSILEDCLGLEISLHFKSFFQVNPAQMEKLYQSALEFANLDAESDVIDLYSGTGTIGMLAARKAKRVRAVEIEPKAVEDGRKNIEANGLENMEIICQDAAQFVKENRKGCDVLFVDPPRKGLNKESISHIAGLDPERLVYISCNPRTLARDLKELEQEGYICQKIQPVDMFPWTSHVEAVALISRKDT